jgi:YidC/Oxa1 family membrane protein insertase
MEKRVFLAIFLSFLVLAAYQALFAPAPPAPAPAPAPSALQSVEAPRTPAAAVTPVVPDPQTPAAAPAAPDAPARDVVVETDSIRAVFSTSGATLKSWTLKKYLENGQPLELVPSDLPDTLPRPFTLATDDATISRVLAKAPFSPSTEGLSIGTAPGTLSFEYRDVSGLNARKTFHFQPEGRPYVVKVEAAVDLAGASKPVRLELGPGLGDGSDAEGSSAYPVRGLLFQADDVEYLTASDLRERGRYEGEIRFAGVEDHYFLIAALPGRERTVIEYAPVTVPLAGDRQGQTRDLIALRVAVPGPLSLPFFLGPKDFDVLRAVDPQLVRAIDFGMFDMLVVPLLLALKWINGFIHNYGWSIVVLTVLINLAIFPLRHRSMVSMKKMQALQPEMKAIQDRYAKFKLTDPERQKMNQEMMALYKQKGVNPVSGCLPMLLTMPILFAFYAMLSVAIELRGAPFLGWIHDLSVRDPLYITPVVMGATMFWQQWLTPSTADPMQKRIFMLMPIIFTFTFLAFPAGLVIYWLVSNLMAISQQLVTNRLLGPPPQPRPLKAAAGAPLASTPKSSRKGQS